MTAPIRNTVIGASVFAGTVLLAHVAWILLVDLVAALDSDEDLA